jgi:hypothetical protein
MCGFPASMPRARFPTSPPSMPIARISITTPFGAQTGSGTCS